MARAKIVVSKNEFNRFLDTNIGCAKNLFIIVNRNTETQNIYEIYSSYSSSYIERKVSYKHIYPYKYGYVIIGSDRYYQFYSSIGTLKDTQRENDQAYHEIISDVIFDSQSFKIDDPYYILVNDGRDKLNNIKINSNNCLYDSKLNSVRPKSNTVLHEIYNNGNNRTFTINTEDIYYNGLLFKIDSLHKIYVYDMNLGKIGALIFEHYFGRNIERLVPIDDNRVAVMISEPLSAIFVYTKSDKSMKQITQFSADKYVGMIDKRIIYISRFVSKMYIVNLRTDTTSLKAIDNVRMRDCHIIGNSILDMDHKSITFYNIDNDNNLIKQYEIKSKLVIVDVVSFYDDMIYAIVTSKDISLYRHDENLNADRYDGKVLPKKESDKLLINVYEKENDSIIVIPIPNDPKYKYINLCILQSYLQTYMATDLICLLNDFIY